MTIPNLSNSISTNLPNLSKKDPITFISSLEKKDSYAPYRLVDEIARNYWQPAIPDLGNSAISTNLTNLSKKDLITFISSLEKIDSYAPYRLVDEIARNYWQPLVLLTLENLGLKSSRLETRNTDCFFTLSALSHIFTDRIKAKKIYSWLTTKSSCSFDITFSKFKITIKIQGLFDGLFVHQANKDPSFDKLSPDFKFRASDCTRKEKESFDQKVNAILNETNENLDEILQNLKQVKYNFNRIIFNALREDIEMSLTKVNAHTSLFFFIVFLPPIKVQAFEHAFTLEAFYAESEKKVRFRIYQSMVEVATLKEDMEKRGYHRNTEGTLGPKKIKKFLDEFEKVCDLESESKESSFCLTYPIPLSHKMTVENKNNKLTINGRSLRYWVHETSPEKIFENAIDLFKEV